MNKYIIAISALIFCNNVKSQPPYQLHDRMQDFRLPVVINTTRAVSSYKDLEKEVTIIDLFGTWCVPCIRALPHLAALQEKYKNRLSVLLVSNERRTKLEKFITDRQPFPFPVVVDEENTITGLFAPPSYPFTIVLDKQRNIIALTDAASVTGQMVERWLAGEKETGITINPSLKPLPVVKSNLTSFNKLVQLSQEFMYAAKAGDSTALFIEQLSSMNYHALLTGLTTDEEKKAFWINLYNGYTQAFLKKDPDRYNNRGRFFSAKQITIAGKRFSLDVIEHGILRRSKIKWSLGHLTKLFPGKTERQLRVDELDYRLHFALNCGAKSCPPIAFYTPENLHPQLELATNAYLRSEVEFDTTKNILRLPAIMGWFRGDFKGKKGMVQLLKDKKIIPLPAKPRIRFKPYDWTLYTDNYKP